MTVPDPMTAADRLPSTGTPTEPNELDPKRVGRDCEYHNCDSTVDDGPLERVNPKGVKGIFMCHDHARIYLTFPREPSPRRRSPRSQYIQDLSAYENGAK